LAKQLDALEADDELPAETKAARSKRARAEAAREVEELVTQAQAALQEGAARTTAMRRARVGRQAERERMRALLARGDAAGELLQRATELGDVEGIAALRNELLWGPAEPEVEALIGECDRALATLSTGDEQAENVAAVNLRESAAGFEELALLATKAVAGKPTATDRMSLGYAETADVS
jgi:hypothetical protein